MCRHFVKVKSTAYNIFVNVLCCHIIHFIVYSLLEHLTVKNDYFMLLCTDLMASLVHLCPTNARKTQEHLVSVIELGGSYRFLGLKHMISLFVVVYTC